MQKAFGAQTPRLVAVAKAEDSALLEQLRQASKANDELSVIFADEATGKVRVAGPGGRACVAGR